MPVRIIEVSSNAVTLGGVDEAVATLESGRLIILPTETVYGVAGRLDLPESVERLDRVRGDSARDKAITPHLPDSVWATRLIGDPGSVGQKLLRKLTPGPVGLRFDLNQPRQAALESRLGGSWSRAVENQSVTLRVPDHPLTSHVLARLSGVVGLIRSSAGDGRLDPAAVQKLEGEVELAFDDGPTRFNRPSTLIHVFDDRFEIIREGVYDRRIVDRLLQTTVLFVCSGNTCRSPMAEAIARRRLAEKFGGGEDALERAGVRVLSAGTFAVAGVRATPQAVEAVREIGADLSNHRSRPLSLDLIHQADQIIAMGRSHAAAILAMAPSVASRVSTLDPDGDIEDPIGGSVEHYRELARRMVGLIDARLAEGILKPNPT